MPVSLSRAALRNFGTILPHQTRGLQRPSGVNSFAIISGTYAQRPSIRRRVVTPNFTPLAQSMSYFNPHSACGAVSLLGRKSNDGPNMAPLLTTALFSAVYATTKNVKAEEESSSIEFEEKILPLLKKKPNTRTIEEKIILFNYLLSKGEEEAAKAKGKDIVVILGNTGAGKSTLINYLYGCTMIKVDGNIIVDPHSPIKEVADIGGDITSCTYIPKKIPEVKFSLPSSDENDHHVQEQQITFYDMPGLSDNRGIEVALANTIALKKLAGYAASVRFVMVCEHAELKGIRGFAWEQSLKLLKERFSNTVGGARSLFVIITKEQSDLDKIKKEMRKFTNAYPELPDLSNHVALYAPLDSSKRAETYKKIQDTTVYSKPDTQITMSGDQLWSALDLGKKIKEEVLSILGNVSFSQTDLPEDIAILLGDKPPITRAKEMLEFTHGIAKLGNQGLTRLHEEACKGVHQLAEKAIFQIEEDKIIANKLDEYKRYKMLKEKFSPYVNFDELDRRLKRDINTLTDERFRWHTADKSLGGTVASICFGFLTALNPLFGIGFVISVLFTAKAVANWWRPSKKDLDMDTFFACDL